MTNVPTRMLVEPGFTCHMSPWVVVASLIGWGILFLGAAIVVVAGMRMLVLSLNRKTPDRIVKIMRAGAMAKIAGWATLAAGMSMSWAGLHMFWSTLAMKSGIPPGITASGYDSSLLPGFCSVLVWSLAMFQAAIAELLGISRHRGSAPQEAQNGLK